MWARLMWRGRAGTRRGSTDLEAAVEAVAGGERDEARGEVREGRDVRAPLVVLQRAVARAPVPEVLVPQELVAAAVAAADRHLGRGEESTLLYSPSYNSSYNSPFK